MRPSLLPGLLAAARRNRNRGLPDVALFELGQTYASDEPKGQQMIASGVRTGLARTSGSGRHWSANGTLVDLFDAKADVVGLLTALGVDCARTQLTRDAPAWFHPGRSGTLRLGPKAVLAHFGEIHPATCRLLDCDSPVVGFEVYLEAVPAEKRKGRTRSLLAAVDLLPVRRDFAFVVDAAVAASDILKAASGVDRALICNVAVFDIFTGGTVPRGQKSVGVEVTLQPTEKTLADAEIDAVASRIVAAVKTATGAEIRK